MGENVTSVDRLQARKSRTMSEYIVPDSHKAKGRRLRQVRTENKMTLRQLSPMLGISHTHLTYIETGQRRFTRDIALRAAAILGVNELEFLPDDLRDDTDGIEAQVLFGQLPEADRQYVLRMMRLMREKKKLGAPQE